MVYKPKGVKLVDITDFDSQRQDIFDKVKEATRASFPRVHSGVRMEIGDDLDYEGPDTFTPEEQTDALLQDKILARKLRGTLNLYDDKSNELLDSQRMTLMNVPWLSSRGTFTHNGNNYTSIKQMRLLPGPYGRFMDNGQLEVHFNVKPGTGPSYRVHLEPDTAQFRLRVGPQSSIHLYSVLKDMGHSDDDMKQAWGEGTWARNAKEYNPKAFKQAYTRMVPPKLQEPDAPQLKQAEQLKEAFNRSQILQTIRDQNLPGAGDQVKSAEIGRAIRATDHEDATGEKLVTQFKPDFKPHQLVDVTNAIYGKHGPRLGSMKVWKSDWINKDVDPLGWLEWYQNYDSGRRTADDERQMKRWLSFKQRNSRLFQDKPSPLRAFSMRNWGIDAVPLLPEEQRGQMRKDMAEYKDKAWADWAAKKASLEFADLKAVADVFNKDAAAGIQDHTTPEMMEHAIMNFVMRSAQDPRTMALKVACLTQFMAANPDKYNATCEGGQLLIKNAYGSLDATQHSDIVEDILSWRY